MYLQDIKRLRKKVNRSDDPKYTPQFDWKTVEYQYNYLVEQDKNELYKKIDSKPKVGHFEDGHIRPILDFGLAYASFAAKRLNALKTEDEILALEH